MAERNERYLNILMSISFLGWDVRRQNSRVAHARGSLTNLT